MKHIKAITLCLLILTSCGGENKNKVTTVDEEKRLTTASTNINIEDIKQRLCSEFPKDLVLQYNPDASHIEIETIDNGSGGILHCNIKLFYGKKEYEHWKGQVSAYINKMEDPFWQYNPKRNASLFHNVDHLGDKAVYISNMYQLQVLKGDVMYSITPPNNGNKTSTGKETKAIAVEIAKHYNL